MGAKENVESSCRDYDTLLVVQAVSPYSFRKKNGPFFMLSSFWFKHINESTNQIVGILCSTII
jgi:hypothetical protein